METLVIFIFIIMLIACLFSGLSVIVALAAGFFLFFGYGILTGHAPSKMGRAAISGVLKIRMILQIFILIGLLTALWREAGTIPAITYYAAAYARPGIMVLMCFLLNCLISFLTGSSFASSATMGVITMSMARMAGVSPLIAGGAILAGVYFGDRSSPVSSSALLIATVTGTDIFDNIRECMKTAVIPFILSCVIYAVLGMLTGGSAEAGDASGIRELFAEEFRLGFLPLVPAILILILASFRVRMLYSMAASILTALMISLFYQQAPLVQVLHDMVLGYRAVLPELSPMISGGGLVSMLGPAVIVSLSSSYAGMFGETGLLQKLKNKIAAVAERTIPFFATVLTSIVTTAVSCNQTLAIILTQQLCQELEPDRQRFAVDMENSTAVIAALIPWNIACAVPLATIGAPAGSILLACYLYLLPLVHLIRRKMQAQRAS